MFRRYIHILKSPLNLKRAILQSSLHCVVNIVVNFRVKVVMLAMLVKPADTSPHECASTYFQTGLRTFLNICRVQSFVEHPTGLLRDAGLCGH